MVRVYIERKRHRAHEELDSFCKLPLEEVIRSAAMAEDAHGKRFGHQRRLRSATLRRARNVLLDATKELSQSDSFDRLHTLIKELLHGIRGLGELYYYDTALRIGASLRLLPKRVYMHRGTREGTRALGLDYRSDSLDPRALPKGLAVLQPHEMEDFLCIFKSRLSPGMRKAM
jgi:hypothetical protein